MSTNTVRKFGHAHHLDPLLDFNSYPHALAPTLKFRFLLGHLYLLFDDRSIVQELATPFLRISHFCGLKLVCSCCQTSFHSAVAMWDHTQKDDSIELAEWTVVC